MRIAFTVAVGVVLVASQSTHASQTPVRRSVFSAKQANAGKMDVQKNSFGTCTDCHTSTLGGRSGNADEVPPLNGLKEDYQNTLRPYGGMVPDLVGASFRSRWAKRSTKNLTQEFLDRFGDVSEETRLNIIAYVLQQNGAVAGTQPLTMTTDMEIQKLFNDR